MTFTSSAWTDESPNSEITFGSRPAPAGGPPDPPEQPAGPWLTQSAMGRGVLLLARRAARTKLPIYLHGETGVGKDVLAQVIHSHSPRGRGPFVPLHCGALAASLSETELFGHVKGAFTGATNGRPGALLRAHGGTLFLDEIGDLSLEVQVKLLRFLENGEIHPVGSDRTVTSDARLICATHHDLERLVAEGKFRRDLYYRIASLIVAIPPLRDRREDIPLLAGFFAAQDGRTLSTAALERLQAHAWPGNTRELKHAIERAVGLAPPREKELSERHFVFLQDTRLSSLEVGITRLASMRLADAERQALQRALHFYGGNRAQAASALGIARSTLFEMMKRHGI